MTKVIRCAHPYCILQATNGKYCDQHAPSICSVCYTEVDRESMLDCKHYLCELCKRELRRPNCPVCKKELKLDDYTLAVILSRQFEDERNAEERDRLIQILSTLRPQDNIENYYGLDNEQLRELAESGIFGVPTYEVNPVELTLPVPHFSLPTKK